MIREITDIESIMAWRAEVLREVFGEEPTAALLEANREYFASAEYLACEIPGEGCGAVCFQREMPSPDNPSGRCAYLMNMYVRRPFRRKGHGSELVRWLVGEARRRGCGKIYLETTAAGRGMYESCGFADFKDIMKLDEV